MILPSDSRLLLLVAGTVLGAGTIVALTAAQQDVVRPTVPVPAATNAATDGVEPALRYGELRGTRRGPNGWMYRSVDEDLVADLPPAAELSNETDADRERVIAERAKLRAYDGAPPSVPHAVTQQTMDCAACHVRGAVVGDKLAPRMSHAMHVSCTQCHVPVADPRPLQPLIPTPENDFVGMAAPLRGERAWAGAPPTIPHTTQMRSECNSCHGPGGKVGLRTPHPMRTSCTQCHTPSAWLDQRPPWIRDEEPAK
jgi:nitrate reductase (cytochrome), electron transfer subunit